MGTDTPRRKLGKIRARAPIRLLSEGTQFTGRFFSFGFEELLWQIAFYISNSWMGVRPVFRR